MNGKLISRLIPILLSLAGLLFLISRLDLQALGDVLQDLDIGLLLLAILIVIASQVLPALRWRILLDHRIGWWRSCTALWVGNFVSALTPLRMGELVRAALIRRSEGIAYTEALSSIVLGQILDVLSIFTMGVILLLVAPLPDILVQTGWVIGGLSVMGIVVLVLLLRYSSLIATRIYPLLTRWLGEAWASRISVWLSNILRGLNSLRNPVQFVQVYGISMVFWLVTALSGWLIALALVDTPPLVLGLAMAFAGGIGRLLPALPGSIGTLDFAVLITLTTLGVDEDTALAIVLLLRLRFTVMVILLGAVALFAEDLDLKGVRHLVNQRRETSTA